MRNWVRERGEKEVSDERERERRIWREKEACVRRAREKSNKGH